MFEEGNVMFALGSGQTTKRFRKINLNAFAAGHGDDRNNTLQCEPQTNRRRVRIAIRPRSVVSEPGAVATGSPTSLALI